MSQRPSILIVDDRPENLRALRQVLSDLDVDVVEADNGNDALKATLYHDFALAILDVVMPGMDGYELASLLRGDARTRRLPLIFMSAAYGAEEQVFKGYESGAVDYLVKPFDPRILLSKARVFLELHQVNTALSEKVAELAASEEKLRLAAIVFQSTAEGVMITNADGTILSVNPAFSHLTGYAMEEVLGKKPNLLRSQHHEPDFYRAMWDALLSQGHWQGEIWNRRKNGEAYLEWLTINLVEPLARSLSAHYVGVFHDITDLRRKDEYIRHLAFHDSLTGLPNRELMGDRLEHALHRARRDGSRLCLMFIDLDRFKSVNDSLGHNVGDLLLVEVARRMAARIRTSDTLARFGGDEFVVLMEDLAEPGHAARLAQVLITQIAQPMQLGDRHIVIGASCGLAIFPNDGDDAMELMKRADTAMYAAKSAGNNGYRFFQHDMLLLADQRLRLEEELRQAIANGDLELHYQPQVDLATGQTVAVEALVRWRHPKHGLQGPSTFIPFAEESGLIREIGAWVLAEACRQAAEWRRRGLALRMAVNVSARQFSGGDLVEGIIEQIELHGIAPGDLEIELTESTVMTNPETGTAQLVQLRQLGVSVAVDDFGTGHSSLAYLHRLPIDVLKIDRSFVLGLNRDQESMQIVKTILALGQALKLTVLAEGIETDEQLKLLSEAGCDLVQGYLLSVPLPADKFPEWLARTMPARHRQVIGMATE